MWCDSPTLMQLLNIFGEVKLMAKHQKDSSTAKTFNGSPSDKSICCKR